MLGRSLSFLASLLAVPVGAVAPHGIAGSTSSWMPAAVGDAASGDPSGSLALQAHSPLLMRRELPGRRPDERRLAGARGDRAGEASLPHQHDVHRHANFAGSESDSGRLVGKAAFADLHELAGERLPVDLNSTEGSEGGLFSFLELSHKTVHANNFSLDGLLFKRFWDTEDDGAEHPQIANATSLMAADADDTDAGWEQIDVSGAICTHHTTKLGFDQHGLTPALAEHSVNCSAGQLLSRWRLSRASTANKMLFYFTCCKLSQELGMCHDRATKWTSYSAGSVLRLTEHDVHCPAAEALNRWHLQYSYATKKINVVYRCCALPENMAFGGCKDNSTAKTTRSTSTLDFAKHDAACWPGFTMVRWALLDHEKENKMNVEYTCCAVGTVVRTGKPRTCAWVGDPHFYTFDGTRLDPTGPGSGITYWVVNNPYVQIQSYYQGTNMYAPAWTRAVAIGGKFLKGHKLVIAKAVNWLTGAPPQYRRSMGTKVLLDGKEVSVESNYHSLAGGLVGIKKSGVQVRINLPLGVNLRINAYPYYLDSFLEMGRPPGGQHGQCGSNDGNPGDDLRRRIEYSHSLQVSYKENLFRKAPLGANAAVKGKKLKDCKPDKLKAAHAACQAKFSGSNHLQEFIDMCVYDQCFTTETTAINTDWKAEAEVKHLFELESGRAFSFATTSSTYTGAKKGCPVGQEIFKVQSKVESTAVFQAISAALGITNDLWLGGEWQNGKWRWHDGTEICSNSFTNWQKGHGKPSTAKPIQPYICIDRFTGHWKQCGASVAGRSIVCATQKKYGGQGFVGPMGARQACGLGKRVAMPKSAAETSRLLAEVKLDTGKDPAWLGGRYDASLGWVWDDGSAVCGYTNWDVNQPDMSKKDTHELWMCMNPLNGKWKVCFGFTIKRVVLCETQTEAVKCPEGAVHLSELGIKEVNHRFHEFMNHCFYIGRATEDCHQTCASQINGYCDHEGLEVAAKSTEACKLVIAGFGGIITSKSILMKLKLTNTRQGCSYVRGKGLMKVVVDKEPGFSPRCGERTSNSNQHRICSCHMTEELDYPADHVMVRHDKVRISGAGAEPMRDFGIVLHGKAGGTAKTALVQHSKAQTHQDEVQQSILDMHPSASAFGPWRFKLVGQVKMKRMLWQEFKSGTWGKARTVLFWPFLKEKHIRKRWSIDLRLGQTRWEVFVNGYRYGFLDHDFQPKVEVNRITATSIVGKQTQLLPMEITDHESPVSYHTNNGCIKQPFGFGSDSILFEFMINMKTVSGWRCIRCEEKDLKHGNNVMMHNGRLVVTINNNAPRMVTFTRIFLPDKSYNVSLSYIRREKAMQMYIDHELVETKHYLRAQRAVLAKAMVGCWHDRRTVLGTITDLQVYPKIPSYRQKHGYCADFKGCKVPLKLKDDAWKWICKGPLCTKKTDEKTCCGPIANCSTYACPEGKTQKAHASLIRCHGETCTHTDRDVCCDDEKLCTTLTCPKHYDQTKVANKTWCDGPQCTLSKDRDRCCIRNPICATYTCPAGWSTKPRHEHVRCKSHPCSDADKTRCCAPLGMCSAFVCPDHYQHRHNASVVYCKDPFCLDTPFQQCCVEKGRCSTLKCPSHMVHNQPLLHSDLYCATLKCTSADIKRCCVARATCDTLTCPKEQTLRANAVSVRCKSYTCDTVIDTPTCCVNKGVCSSYKCPTNYIHKPNASSILCGDETCGQSGTTSYRTCCDEVSRCSSYKCPAGFLHKKNVSEIHCQGGVCMAKHRDVCCNPAGKCNSYICPYGKTQRSRAWEKDCLDVLCADTDEDTCCDRVGRCTTYTCPAGWTLRVDAPKRICKKQVCDDTDWHHCCVEKSMCSSYTCPTGWNRRPDANSLACFGWRCSGQDLNLCCEKRESCAGFACPYHMKPKGDAGHLLCKLEVCTSQDTGTCCSKLGYCSSFVCPPGYVHAPKAHDILCDDHECVNTNFKKCCVSEAVCESYTCPDGYLPAPYASNLSCASWRCTDADRDRCCSIRAKCNSMQCPHGQTHKSNAPAISCKGRVCKEEDASACCDKQGMCSTFKCPRDYLHRADKDKLLCEDAACNNTGYERCCATASSCSTYICPMNFTLRHNAESLLCHGFNCSDYDLLTCCDRLESCSAYACPNGMILHPMAQNMTCQGTACSALDAFKCCISEGRCDTYECPTGTVLRHDARSIFCGNSTCSMTPYQKCCTQQNLCTGYQCPAPKYILRPDHDQVFCAGWRCSDEDVETCCERAATCVDAVCPAPLVHRLKPAEVPCSGRHCNVTDTARCCTHAGMCSDYNCPSAYLHKQHADSVSCKHLNCTNEDYTRCCVVRNRCDAMHCPLDMVHRHSADKLYCQGYECGDLDIHTCCFERARCNTLICPFGKTLRKDANDHLCESHECKLADVDTCCVMQGTCENYTCPPGYGLKNDAHEVMCGPDPDCIDLSYEVCCDALATCDAYKCPKYLVPKTGDMSSIFCSGPKCDYMDKYTCCDEKATCETYHCPEHYSAKPSAHTIMCLGSGCTDEDLHTCCTREDRCATMLCPVGTKLRFDAHDVVCSDHSCDQQDEALCCVSDRSCKTYTCPYGLAHRLGADGEHALCESAPCTEDDESTCCGFAATCQSYECPPHHILRPHPFLLFCAGEKCSERDLNTCCASQGTCNTFNCPPGYSHRYDAPEIQCEGFRCNDDADVACCAKENECDSYACPVGFSRKADAWKSTCRSHRCSDADIGTCCTEEGRCTSFMCPEGYSPKDGYMHLHCAETKCTELDKHTCCDKKASCGNFTCPSHMLKKSVNATCAGPVCTDEDAHHCCSRKEHCSKVTCPTDMVARGGEYATCKALKCDSSDVETCCLRRALCKTLECPSGMLPKAPTTLCQFENCTASDLHTCCREDPAATASHGSGDEWAGNTRNGSSHSSSGSVSTGSSTDSYDAWRVSSGTYSDRLPTEDDYSDGYTGYSGYSGSYGSSQRVLSNHDHPMAQSAHRAEDDSDNTSDEHPKEPLEDKASTAPNASNETEDTPKPPGSSAAVRAHACAWRDWLVSVVSLLALARASPRVA